MKSIVVGAGKVGYSLVANLCAAGHDVTAIDRNRHRLDILEEHFNVNTIQGNAARLATLRQADIAHADLLIAVTERDELNMVAGFVAKKAGAKSTVARVRNPGYSDFDDTDRLNALGVDMIINPEKVTAAEIAKLIAFPEADYVGFFGDGQVQMLEVKLTVDGGRLGVPLRELDCPVPCIVVAIEREGGLLIPKGDTCLMPGDAVLLLANTEEMRQVEEYFHIDVKKPRNIMILGGNLSGYYLAEMLEQSGRRLNVKVFEPDYDACEELTANLKHTVVINSGGSNISLYEDENVGSADVFVAATEDDKENLFAGVLAKSLGARKIIIQIRGTEHAQAMERVGMDKVVCPARLTADAILRFINRNRILSLTRFNDSAGQITEYRIPDKARAAGQPLKDIGFPAAALICMLIRGRQHIIPRGSDSILPGDTAIVFSLPEALRKVEALLTEEEK